MEQGKLTDDVRRRILEKYNKAKQNYVPTELDEAREDEFQQWFENNSNIQQWKSRMYAQQVRDYGIKESYEDWVKGIDANDTAYDYRGAFESWENDSTTGVPKPYRWDKKGNFHWDSIGMGHKELKNPDHPSSWKEWYGEITNTNPDEVEELRNLTTHDIVGEQPAVEKKSKGGSISNKKKGDFQLALNDKTFEVEVANTPKQRKEGLSGRDITANTAMLFVFPKVGKHQMWMKDTHTDLDIYFLDQNAKVLELVAAKAEEAELLGSFAQVKYVLELPASTTQDIAVGAELEIPEQYKGNTEDSGTDELILLDEKGNHQMNLKGGERIFSREKTKQVVDGSMTAKTDEDITNLGKLVADEVIAQDTRGPEYVSTTKGVNYTKK